MRKAVLMKALEDIDVEEGFDWREVAVMTEGYSCGDVVELCREVCFGSIWRPCVLSVYSEPVCVCESWTSSHF